MNCDLFVHLKHWVFLEILSYAELHTRAPWLLFQPCLVTPACFFPLLLGSSDKVLWPIVFPRASSLSEKPKSCNRCGSLSPHHTSQVVQNCTHPREAARTRARLLEIGWRNKTLQVIYANSPQSTPMRLHMIFPLPILKILQLEKKLLLF